MLICSKCGSNKIYKNGTRNSKQRYECGNCHSEANPINMETLNKDEDVLKENVKLAKQKQKIQDKSRIERKSFREIARIENAVEEYTRELKSIIKEKKIPNVKPHKINNPKSLIVHLSDTHFNELVDIVDNKYDFKIASQRLYKFADKIIQYLKVHNIKTVYVTITGDLLNSDRRLDELLSMATNRAKATFLGAKLLAQFIADINQYANVNIISVTGNESRIREDYTYTDAMATDNFDFMIYEILKIIFEDSKSVNFLNGDGYEYVFEINKTTILVCHGHQLGNMRVNDISKAISKWSKRGINIDMILCGHLHETKITDTLGRCGSLVGNNAYSDIALNMHGKASQNLYLIYQDGTIDSIRVDLQNITDKDKMYEVDTDLEAYNAKSINKATQKVEVFKIII